MNFDTFAFIPIIGTTILAVVLCALLVVIKWKNTAKVSYVMFLSIVVAVGCLLHVLLRPKVSPVMILSLMCFAIFALLLCYAALLCTIKTRAKDASMEGAKDLSLSSASTPSVVQEVKVLDIAPKEIDLLGDCKAYITRATEGYGNKEGLQAMLEYVNTTLKDATSADGALVLLVDDFDDDITVRSYIGSFPPPYKLPPDLPHKAIRVDTNLKHAQFPLHDNIFGEIAINGEAELINDPKGDNRIVINGPEDFLKCGAYMFLPLKVQDTVFGLIALSRSPSNKGFTEEEFTNAKLLAEFASSSIKTIFSVQDVLAKYDIDKEASIVTKIQQSLLALKPQPLPGVTVGVFNNSSSGVCGDYFDVIAARGDRIAFIMADVAGKGLKSMVVMVMIKAILSLIVNTTQSCATILNWANRGLTSEVGADRFASLLLMLYNPIKRTLQVSSGGNIPLLLYSHSRDIVEKMPLTSDPLGIEHTTVYKDMDVSIGQGDILVAYTDGLLENQNDKGLQYSYDDLVALVKKNAQGTGRDIAQKIKSSMTDFSGCAHIHDDQSLMVVKIQ